jgi:ABC-type Fe3+ transport system permease subunit
MPAIKEHQQACPDRLSYWSDEVRAAFGHLSKPQVWGLVLWSAGIALSGAAGITQLSALLALVLEQKEQTVFQRLREW